MQGVLQEIHQEGDWIQVPGGGTVSDQQEREEQMSTLSSQVMTTFTQPINGKFLYIFYQVIVIVIVIKLTIFLFLCSDLSGKF